MVIVPVRVLMIMVMMVLMVVVVMVMFPRVLVKFPEFAESHMVADFKGFLEIHWGSILPCAAACGPRQRPEPRSRNNP